MWPPTLWEVIINTFKSLWKDLVFFYNLKQTIKKKLKRGKNLWQWFLLFHWRARRLWRLVVPLEEDLRPWPATLPSQSSCDLGQCCSPGTDADLLPTATRERWSVRRWHSKFWFPELIKNLEGCYTGPLAIQRLWGPSTRVWFMCIHNKSKLMRGREATTWWFLLSVFQFQIPRPLLSQPSHSSHVTGRDL